MPTANLYWSDWLNAEIYNRYVHDYPIYVELNRRLVELAEMPTARRVLDLASGAGATAQRCLHHLPRDGEIVGVDASEAMVSLARSQIADPRASFTVATAETVHDRVSGSFDRAVCNAAFWQLATPLAVLPGLARLLEPEALFVFNVPAELVLGESTEIHPLQMALATAIELESDRSFAVSPTYFDPNRLEEELARSGFALESRERFVYRGRQEELVELMRIPAMIAPLTPDLSSEERQDVVDRAGRRTDPDERVEVPWIYFTARRSSSQPR